MVILHLEPDWSPQSPKNIEQALKDQLALFLEGEIGESCTGQKPESSDHWQVDLQEYTPLCAAAGGSVLHSRDCMSSSETGSRI